MSKAALNIASVSLANDLKYNNIAVGIVHPGMVATDMIGILFAGEMTSIYMN